MKIVKWIGIVIAVMLVLGFVVGAFLPDSYHVERVQVIKAEPAMIHLLVTDLMRWPEWAPWQETDPSIETTYGTITSGVGAYQSWIGKSGDGMLTITASSPESGIEYDLSFDEGQYVSSGAINYHVTAEGTEVTWQMNGEMQGTVEKYFGLMMDTMVGTAFEKGLTNMKTIAEGSSTP